MRAGLTWRLATFRRVNMLCRQAFHRARQGSWRSKANIASGPPFPSASRRFELTSHPDHSSQAVHIEVGDAILIDEAIRQKISLRSKERAITPSNIEKFAKAKLQMGHSEW